MEDIEPIRLSMDPSSPSRTPPSSPSKRRQSSSHYSDLDCSPSKRRTRALLDERGMLFNTTNSPMKVDGVATPRKVRHQKESWIGSPMKVDTEEVERGFGIEEIISSPMKVDKEQKMESKNGRRRHKVGGSAVKSG
jgi:hypothetical protein